MVFIATTVPIEELKSKDDIFYTYDWFIFQASIKNKNIKYDDLFYLIYCRVKLYRFWYNKPLYIYLMTDNYYYNNNDLYGIMKNTYRLIKSSKMPEYYSEENVKAYPVLPAEERIMTEQDILEGFEKFRENNFKKNPIVKVIIGDST